MILLLQRRKIDQECLQVVALAVMGTKRVTRKGMQNRKRKKDLYLFIYIMEVKRKMLFPQHHNITQVSTDSSEDEYNP